MCRVAVLYLSIKNYTVFISANEVMFSLAFVCLFVSKIIAKTTPLIVTKFAVKVARRPRKKSLDIGGNSDHVRVRVGVVLGLPLGGGPSHTSTVTVITAE